MYQKLQRAALPIKGKPKSKAKVGAGSEGDDAAGEGGEASKAAKKADSGAGAGEGKVDVQRGVMQELAGKSAYMRQIEEDRVRMQPMIQDLAAQIGGFKPLDMHQLCFFVAEVERRLALLSDERMVLKSFETFPEKRLEAMREACARKVELEKLAGSMDPLADRWQARCSIAEELDQVIQSFSTAKPKVEWYMREAEGIRKCLLAHGVPFDMDLIKNAQHAPLGLAKYAMRMLVTSHERIQQADEAAAAVALPLLLSLTEQALKFAFQCHQFAGGFDSESNELFTQLHRVVTQGA